MKSKPLLTFLLCCIVLVCISILLTSCQVKNGKGIETKELKVVTSLFPLYDFAKNVGGQKVDVILLLPPGTEPHGFEPRPGDITKIHKADIFVYTGRHMEPWVEDILNGINRKNLMVIDTSKDIQLAEGYMNHDSKHGFDPHVWLDLSNAQKMVDTIRDGFITKDPAHKDYYSQNAEGYKTRLHELDKRFKDSFVTCKKDVFIHGGHFAFGYFAKRYNLKYLSAYKGFSPDAEPTPRNLIELSKKLKQNNVEYIYYEELIMPRVAETIARETGAKLLMLHAAHNVTRDDMNKGVTFLSIMEQNLRNLKIGLQCQ